MKSRFVPVLCALVLLAPVVDAADFTLRLPLGLHNRGGTPNPWLSGEIRPLGLTTEEQADLVAFLEALTGEIGPEVTSPPQLPK